MPLALSSGVRWLGASKLDLYGPLSPRSLPWWGFRLLRSQGMKCGVWCLKLLCSPGAGAPLSENIVMDVRQPHRKTKKRKRRRTPPGSFLLFFHGSPPTLAINSDIYLLVSPPFCRLQNFYLLLSPPSWRSHPPNLPLLHEPASDLITAFLPSSYPSVSASPPTMRCSALEPSPPRWAGLGNAGGFSLSLSLSVFSLSACLPACLSGLQQHKLPVSTSLPPQHCAALPPILALSSSHSLSLLELPLSFSLSSHSAFI